MLFKKRKTEEMEEKVLTAEEALDIKCEATRKYPIAGELQRIMEKAGIESEVFFCDTVIPRINGLIFSSARKSVNAIDFQITDVTTFTERENFSCYHCLKWLKKYYSLSGLKVDAVSYWNGTTYTISWER